MFERKDYVITFLLRDFITKIQAMFIVLPKKEIFTTDTQTNIRLSRYSDKKVSPYKQKYIYSPNVPICRYIYIIAVTNLAVGIIVCRWRRKDRKFYR